MSRSHDVRHVLLIAVLLLGGTGLLAAPLTDAHASSPSTPTAIPTAVSAAATPPGGYVALDPTRLLDTRVGIGAPSAPIGPGATVHLQVAGRGGVPDAGAAGVVLNVLISASTAAGTLVVDRDGIPVRRGMPNLYFARGETASVPVTLQLSSTGRIAVTNRSAGTLQAFVDVVGYYRGRPDLPSWDGAFGPLGPVRWMTTRTVPAHGVINFSLTENGDPEVPLFPMPSTVVLNVMVSAATRVGSLTAYPYGGVVPGPPSLYFVPGRTVSRAVVVHVSADTIVFANNSSGSLRLSVDGWGRFQAGAPGVSGAFGSLRTARVLDTRVGIGAPAGPLGPNQTVHLQVTGHGGVPAAHVSAVTLNVVATSATAVGRVIVDRDGLALRPGMSNLYFRPGATAVAPVTVRLSTAGRIALTNVSSKPIALFADVLGYVRDDTPLTPAATVEKSCAVGPSGGVRCWGSNFYGQLGNNTGIDSSVPVPVVGLGAGVLDVSAASTHTCAVTGAGAAVCWGEAYLGALGNYSGGSGVPLPVTGLGSGVAQVSAGGFDSCAVTVAGAALCWGNNYDGQVGNGSAANVAELPATPVGLTANVTALSTSGLHACAVQSGAIKCWGLNTRGELGDGTLTTSRVPVAVAGLGGPATAVAAGVLHTCALTAAGGVMCWGENSQGQLGDGSTTSSSVPVGVVGLDSGVVAVAAGDEHSCALTAAGAVKCWGTNTQGDLGTGTGTGSTTPVTVGGLDAGITALSERGNCAVTTDHVIACWGPNPGNGSLRSVTRPEAVVGYG